MITKNCRLPVGAYPFEKSFEIRVAPYQYRTADGLSEQEMDRPWPTFVMESHINFCALYSGKNNLGTESVKIGFCQLASSITPEEYCNNAKPVI